MEDRELPLTPLTICQNPHCALEKSVLKDMVQIKSIECRGSCAMELKQLKEEMAQLKRDMSDLVAKKQEKKDQLILISPSYSVRSMSVDKEGAYKTLVDKTRIMEEQLMDIIRSLEESDTPDHNRPAPSEVGTEKQTEELIQPTERPSSVREERNLPQMLESEPGEGENGTSEQHHVAETPRVALDELPDTVMENEDIEVGLVLEATEQENQEQLQPSEIQKQKHIEIVSDIVELARDCEGEISGGCGIEKEQPLELIELSNSVKPQREDLQVEHLELVELPNTYNYTQQYLQIEQPVDGVELPEPDNSMQQGLQIEQLKFVDLPKSEKSPLQDLHMADIISNPICISMNLECSLDVQHLGPCDSGLFLDHIESTIEIEKTLTDVPKDSEIDPQERVNELSGATEAYPYQSGEQQSDDRIHVQLMQVETPRPELPCPGQPEEVRIAKMVEELVLQQQQQNTRTGGGKHELIPFNTTDATATSQKPSRPQRQRRPPPKIYTYTEHRSPKQPRPKKVASKATPDSDGALDVMPLNVHYYSEEMEPSERRTRKQSKRKLDYSSIPPKQKGRPRSISKLRKKKQPKRQKPDSETDVKTPSDDQQQDEGEASQRSTASLMSQDEHQASKTPAREAAETEMPDSEAAVETVSPSDDQQQQQEGNKKEARLNARVIKEWLARQGLLDGRKSPGKV